MATTRAGIGLDVRTSGDAVGSRHRVVGCAAFGFPRSSPAHEGPD
jgi:hypothetical protein